jgi:hypothetical protein
MNPAKVASMRTRGAWTYLALLLTSAGCGATKSTSPTSSAGAAGDSAGGGPSGHAGSALAGGAPNSTAPVVECGDVADPQAGCPRSPQLTDAGCTTVSLCDYDTCGDGCTSTFVCSPGSATLAGPTRVCGAVCEPTRREADPWQRNRSLSFAERSGDCGKISSLTFDPQTNKLGALACEVVADEQVGCVSHRELDCTLEGTQLTLDLHVTFRTNRGWRGEATMQVGGSAPACSSKYWVAL